MEAKYVHTNLVARNWRALAAFYERVFGCVRIPPERDLSGPWLEAATHVPGAHISGVHLRLPGCGTAGPTLEIFQYHPSGPECEPAVYRPGFAHIAFQVDDVAAARQEVLAAGGKALGEVVASPIAGVGTITFVYMTDPEGNVIELQSWSGRSRHLD